MELGFFFSKNKLLLPHMWNAGRQSSLSFLASRPKRHLFTPCTTQDPENHTGT